MRQVILVNGVPATGKSTIAVQIAGRLGLPVFGIDTVKEALFAHLGTGDREYSRLLGRASYQAIFATIAGFPPAMGAVIDAWHGFQPLEVLMGHLQRANIGHVTEIWCHAPPEVVVARFRDRLSHRHSGHIGLSYVGELEQLATRAEPLRIGPVVTVDTTVPLDLDRLTQAVRQAQQEEAPGFGSTAAKNVRSA